LLARVHLIGAVLSACRKRCGSSEVVWTPTYRRPRSGLLFSPQETAFVAVKGKAEGQINVQKENPASRK
jgi:hypothetical protein